MPSTKATVAIGALCLLLGVWIGHDDDKAAMPVSSPAPHPIALADSQQPKETVTVTTYRMTPECEAANSAVVAMKPNLFAVIDSSGRQTDILSDAYVSIVTKDTRGLNRAGAHQNELVNSTSSARRDLLVQIAGLEDKIKLCHTSTAPPR